MKLSYRLKPLLKKIASVRSGQTLVEYAVIIAMVSVVAIVVLQSLGSKVTQLYSTINNTIDAAQSSS
jgi:Flp pilus assembly pilin Flp